MTVGNTTRMVRQLQGTFYTVSEAAALVGRSPRTLRRWAEGDPQLRPSHVHRVGGLTINLYTPHDIEVLKRKASS